MFVSCLDLECKKELVYQIVSSYLLENNIIANDKQFLQELESRENLGSIEIYPNFYLPHIVSDSLKQHIILRVLADGDRFLFILLKDDNLEMIDKVKKLISRLLDKSYIDKLYACTKNEFILEMKNIK